ncbi:unnamed protein product [Staurois parvus]|uniref:Uncharacterized protein n=1 Tax=Staurois parvus TaxID=386267 RepID=A0ABN9E8S7_9NEOB|nr:unnamed protein product [Staurois parvus]
MALGRKGLTCGVSKGLTVCCFTVCCVCLTASTLLCMALQQGRTDYWGTRALPEGPGSVGGPMRCFFGCDLSVGEDTGAP